jgi:hypothetical protein
MSGDATMRMRPERGGISVDGMPPSASAEPVRATASATQGRRPWSLRANRIDSTATTAG